MYQRKITHKIFLSLLMIGMLLLTACSSKKRSGSEEASEAGAYHKIDADTAKQMIDSGEQELTIVDVRTKEEFDAGHLADALLLPVETIGREMPEILPDKDATLIVYCRSGRRSREAADKLIALGYQNIYDMGGIIDWPYHTISEK